MIVVLRVQEPASTPTQETGRRNSRFLRKTPRNLKEPAELEDPVELEEPVELEDVEDADVEAALCAESSVGYPFFVSRCITGDKSDRSGQLFKRKRDFIIFLLPSVKINVQDPRGRTSAFPRRNWFSNGRCRHRFRGRKHPWRPPDSSLVKFDKFFL